MTVLVSTTQEAFLDRLRAEPRVWVRLAANRPLDVWQLSLLEIVAGEPPPGWKRQRWIYKRAVFIAAAVSGSSVAGWFARKRIRLGPFPLSITLQDTIQVERRRSRFAGIFERLEWPSVEWRIPLVQDANRQMLHGELVADDAPAFLSYDLAGAAFFGVPQPPGGRSFSGLECVFREQDLSARIERVQIRSTEVLVSVGGAKLGDKTLTIGGVNGQSKALRRTSSLVRFPLLADRIEAGSWVALRKGSSLLDERGLDPAWGRSDVEVEIDPLTHAELLISGGESATTEFKRQLPSDKRDDIKTAMKTVAAFANANGGTMLFGVDNHGVVVGLELDTARAAMDRVTNLVTDWVRPPVDFTTSVTEVDNKPVLMLEVERGHDVPYGIGTNDRGLEYFIRRNGTSMPARADEVRAAVQARAPAPQARAGTLPY
jgi:hypothetical protein